MTRWKGRSAVVAGGMCRTGQRYVKTVSTTTARIGWVAWQRCGAGTGERRRRSYVSASATKAVPLQQAGPSRRRVGAPPVRVQEPQNYAPDTGDPRDEVP